MPEANLPVIPEFITVHLGAPSSDAQNVQVSFRDYIKNVASSEIYPTWPETAIRANVLAQISYALNRVYTEYYRSRGYNFDITNSTAYDQAFVQGRDIFENVSRIVDDIFNDYIVREGNIEPLFAQFCSGTTVTCDGLSQWGSVALAEEGLLPYEILRSYYGQDINIVDNAPVQDIEESYPGFPLRIGSSGNLVRTLQIELNRIGDNYPAIKKISSPDGTFGAETEAAVLEFQKIFNLARDGVVGKSTWYKIKSIYNGVKGLSELQSEGIKYEDVQNVYTTRLAEGSQGYEVEIIQYYLASIAYFNENIPVIKIDGIFGPETKNATLAFQQYYGLPQTGEIDEQTWYRLRGIYNDFIAALPPGYEEGKAEIYPGYVIKKGATGRDVTNLQTYLSFIADSVPEVLKPVIDGTFGDGLEESVKSFQRRFGLPQTGTVGPITWLRIANKYNEIKGL